MNEKRDTAGKSTKKDKIKKPKRDKKGWFLPGSSGNPLGRSKNTKNFETIYRQALKKLAELNKEKPEDLELQIISKALVEARGGNFPFYKDTLDRVYGKPIQPIGGDPENPLLFIEIDEKRYKNIIRREANDIEEGGEE